MTTTIHSAFETYIRRNPDEFSDAQKQIDPARLPDQLLWLVLDVYYGAEIGHPGLPSRDGSDLSEYWARVVTWMRRTVPDLSGLSDQEIDVALKVAIGMDVDAGIPGALP